MSNEREFRVVGLTFVPNYPANVEQVATMVNTAQVDALGWSGTADADAAVTVALVRNPENEYDENAIEVHVPTLGRKASMIGHVPRDLAARLAPSIDRGDVWAARIAAVLVDPEHPDRPGVEVVLSRVQQTAA